jgi:HD-GYP domain-containing protein (c-di-GMP phosphodiesterase class II)
VTIGTDAPVRAFRRSVRSLLADLAEKDPSSHGRPERMAYTVAAIGTAHGLDRARVQGLVLAAHLHDVGKISIPEPILLKAGPLTPPEYEVVKRHCLAGSRLIEASGLHEVARWIRSHHERWDGSGYPDGLAGVKIPLEARILGIADALDAMTSPRFYREPISAMDAADEFEACAGSQFDPDLAGWMGEALRTGMLQVAEAPVELTRDPVVAEPVRELVTA